MIWINKKTKIKLWNAQQYVTKSRPFIYELLWTKSANNIGLGIVKLIKEGSHKHYLAVFVWRLPWSVKLFSKFRSTKYIISQFFYTNML